MSLPISFTFVFLRRGRERETNIRIDPKHPSIENHGPHSTIAEEESKASKKAAREALSEEGVSNGSGSGGVKGKGKEIFIEEMWKPSSTSLQFWEACGVE
jgi:hypothetical protein